MYPYLDLAGFQRRTVVPDEFVDEFEAFSRGWIARKIAARQSWINSRLRKRYGNATNGNSLPLGQTPPLLTSKGTSPPAVTLSGVPQLGSLEIQIQIQTPGALGTASFLWSSDSSIPSVGPLVTAALVALPGTGLTANFAATGAYSSDNLYQASTPVVETVLGWLVDLVNWDMMVRRYRNSQDPAIEDFKRRFDQAMAEITEAANSRDALFDLPPVEDADSAVTTGGPLVYSETSPYVWQDEQRCTGIQQDRNRTGSFG